MRPKFRSNEDISISKINSISEYKTDWREIVGSDISEKSAPTVKTRKNQRHSI